MTDRTRTLAAPAAVLLATMSLLTIGCGSDSGDSGGSGTTTTAARPATADAETVREALVKNEYTIAIKGPSGRALERLDVSGAGVKGTHVYFYGNAADADRDAVARTRAAAFRPRRTIVRAKGSRVYWITSRNDLTATERSVFSEIVAISEKAL